MVELFINGSKVEGKFPIALSFSITDGWDRVRGAFSKTFTVPATPTNQSIFSYVEYLGSTASRDATAVIRADGVDIVNGFARVDKIKIGNAVAYEIVVFSGNKNWIKELEGKTFKNLTWGSVTYTDLLFTGLNLNMSMLIRMNNFKKRSQSNKSYYDFSQFRHTYNVGDVLSKIGTFLNINVDYSSFLNKLWIPHTTRIGWTDAQIKSRSIHYVMSTDQAISGSGYITIDGQNYYRIEFDTKVSDDSNLWNTTTNPKYNFVPPVDAWYWWRSVLYLSYAGHSNDTETEVWQYCEETGEKASLGTIVIPKGAPGHINLIIDIERRLEAGKHYSIILMYDHEEITVDHTKSDLQITRKKNKVYYGDTLDINDIAPEWSLKDFVAGLKHLFNLRFDFDKFTNTLSIKTENEYYNGGTWRDITDRIAHYGYNFSWYERLKTLEYSYKKDSNQKYVTDEYRKGTYEFSDNGKEFKSENPFFAFTRMQNMGSYYIPMIRRDDTKGIITNDYVPRIIYLDTSITKTIPIDYYYVDTDGYTRYEEKDWYPAWTHWRDNEINGTTVDRLLFEGSRGLFETYHKAKIKRLTEARKLQVKLRMDIVFLNEISFADTFVIDSRETPEINGNYHLLEIQNFNPDDHFATVILVQSFNNSDDITISQDDILADFETEDDGVNYDSEDSGEKRGLKYLNDNDETAFVYYLDDVGQADIVQYKPNIINI